MDRNAILAGLRSEIPVSMVEYYMPAHTGLVIVDQVNGFCTPGMGPLAPPAPDARIEQMVGETDVVAREFVRRWRPIFVLCDTHVPGVPEPPYPPHCERGTGQELLVPRLDWLNVEARQSRNVIVFEKDCINGFVGAIRKDGRNAIVDWVNENQLDAIIMAGICTDICDSDFVVAMLSARNHGLMPTLRDIVAYEPACSTYDLPCEVAVQLGLPATAAHPQDIAHHIGLWTMQSRGAIIANNLAR